MKIRSKKLIKIFSIILVIWSLLTLIAERKGTENITIIGEPTSEQKALILYDPDPFYNLDEQISKSFAEGLAENGWLSKVITVSAASGLNNEQFNLYVFCANTYNWSPDWAISNFIKNSTNLKGKNVIAITLGSGSTGRSQRILETQIKQKEAILLASKVYWLMKPNDESRAKESNVEVAVDMANTFGKQIAESLKDQNNNE